MVETDIQPTRAQRVNELIDGIESGTLVAPGTSVIVLAGPVIFGGGGVIPFPALPRPIGSVAAEIVASLRFRRKIEKIHSLGPRVTAELLAEIGAERNIFTIIDQKLERYAGLDSATVAATGGDDFWPAPLTETRP